MVEAAYCEGSLTILHFLAFILERILFRRKKIPFRLSGQNSLCLNTLEGCNQPLHWRADLDNSAPVPLECWQGFPTEPPSHLTLFEVTLRVTPTLLKPDKRPPTTPTTSSRHNISNIHNQQEQNPKTIPVKNNSAERRNVLLHPHILQRKVYLYKKMYMLI